MLYELNNSLVRATGLQVERLVYTNNSANIHGSTGDFNQLNNVKSLILGNPLFETVDIKDQRSYLGPLGENRVRFNLIVKPKKQEE